MPSPTSDNTSIPGFRPYGPSQRRYARRGYGEAVIRHGRIQASCTGPMMEATNQSIRVKAFCVGQAKAGTASLVGLLATNYRVAHEPEREEMLDMILRESRHDISARAFRSYLLERDARLDLEYDVAWANQFIIGHLQAVFPAAKYIILIRDSYTWLQSVTGHLISRDVPSDVLTFLRWWFKPEQYPYSRYERSLE